MEEHVEETPQTTHNKNVLEANNDLKGGFVLHNDSVLHHLLSLDKFDPDFDRCKELISPHLRNKIKMFKYLCRLQIINNIAKLRFFSTWAYVQQNSFLGQSEKTDKVLIFKMSKIGRGSGVDLVRSMQHDRDLKHVCIMSDYVKHMAKWTTMAYHVYDKMF